MLRGRWRSGEKFVGKIAPCFYCHSGYTTTHGDLHYREKEGTSTPQDARLRGGQVRPGTVSTEVPGVREQH